MGCKTGLEVWSVATYLKYVCVDAGQQGEAYR
jgi:hypothetical protein